VIETERLILRAWQESDRAPFAAMNADAQVMEFFGFTRDRAESDRLVERLMAHIDRHGFGFWTLERKEDGAFLGFTGLQHVPFEAAFTPAVEIGCRLARTAWGKGYATEAALASLDHGFGALGLEEIVSFAVAANRRSRAVMERIGMEHRPAMDFAHPHVAADSPLSRHVLYRIAAEAWRDARGRS
jgi:ribosomal-protein-alanine N-acetyltransferase